VATAVVYTLRRLARRILGLTDEIRDLQHRLTTHAPQLLQPVGIGPDSAAALLITAGDNPDQLASEASFAALCGVSPIEASSGKTRRETIRCLKRYVAREIYNLLQPPTTPTSALQP
jgi:transposase